MRRCVAGGRPANTPRPCPPRTSSSRTGVISTKTFSTSGGAGPTAMPCQGCGRNGLAGPVGGAAFFAGRPDFDGVGIIASPVTIACLTRGPPSIDDQIARRRQWTDVENWPWRRRQGTRDRGRGGLSSGRPCRGGPVFSGQTLHSIAALNDLPLLVAELGHEPRWEPFDSRVLDLGRRTDPPSEAAIVGCVGGFTWYAVAATDPARLAPRVARRLADRGKVCGVFGLNAESRCLAVSVAFDGTPVLDLHLDHPTRLATSCLVAPQRHRAGRSAGHRVTDRAGAVGRRPRPTVLRHLSGHARSLHGSSAAHHPRTIPP